MNDRAPCVADHDACGSGYAYACTADEARYDLHPCCTFVQLYGVAGTKLEPCLAPMLTKWDGMAGGVLVKRGVMAFE